MTKKKVSDLKMGDEIIHPETEEQLTVDSVWMLNSNPSLCMVRFEGIARPAAHNENVEFEVLLTED
jgi:hypothetical protein